MTTNFDPQVYSIKETCELSRLGKTRVYQLINAKTLQVTRVGRRTLVNAASLHKLLASGC